MDVDRKCDGRRAHEVEMPLGTSIVHQVIVDDAPGVTKLTYVRPVNTPRRSRRHQRDRGVLRHVDASADSR